MEPIREKRHRLPEAAYHGRIAVAFTACEKERRCLLANQLAFAAITDCLTEAAKLHHCVVGIYTVMPDHLHALIVGTEENSRPKDAMSMFKHRSQFRLSQLFPEFDWQDNFYDRIVRKSEGWAQCVRYFALNPVRAELAPDIDSWPYTGAVGCDLRDSLTDAFW